MMFLGAGVIALLIPFMIPYFIISDLISKYKIKKKTKKEIEMCQKNFLVYHCTSCGGEALWNINDEKICPYCNKVISEDEVK